MKPTQDETSRNTTSRTCAHPPCRCEISAADARGAARYCSEGCAQGMGCSCPRCNCAAS